MAAILCRPKCIKGDLLGEFQKLNLDFQAFELITVVFILATVEPCIIELQRVMNTKK